MCCYYKLNEDSFLFRLGEITGASFCKGDDWFEFQGILYSKLKMYILSIHIFIFTKYKTEHDGYIKIWICGEDTLKKNCRKTVKVENERS